MIDTFSKLHANYDWPIAPSLSHMSNQSFSQIISHCYSLLPVADFNLFAIDWCFIWYFRNQLVFQDAPSSHSTTAIVINNFSKSWLRSSYVVSDWQSSSATS